MSCTLNKGAANSCILHQIIIEAIVHLEKSGFFIDVVTTDGALWNRSMWTKFGITESIVSCEHICDEKRRLWFMSDFPHLIKIFRNSLIKRRENKKKKQESIQTLKPCFIYYILGSYRY